MSSKIFGKSKIFLIFLKYQKRPYSKFILFKNQKSFFFLTKMTKRKIDTVDVPYYYEVVLKPKPEFIKFWKERIIELEVKIIGMRSDSARNSVSYMRALIDLLLEILNTLDEELDEYTWDKIGNGVECRKNRVEKILSYFNQDHYGIVGYLLYENNFINNIVIPKWPRKNAHDKYCYGLNKILGKAGEFLVHDAKHYYHIPSDRIFYYEDIKPITASLYLIGCMSSEIIEYILFYLILCPVAQKYPYRSLTFFERASKF